ncbi:MAG: hypothetical protein SF028_14565 [Candidatus Sumerlaeia bacterium]|nr:hypothetical protein [Candidatus Sumerlaeia bacterium]
MAKDVVEFSLEIEKFRFTFKGAREKGEALGQGLQRTLESLNGLQRQALTDSNVIDVEPAQAAPVAPPPPARSRRRRRSSSATASNGATTSHEAGSEEGAARRNTGTSPTALLRELRRSGFFREARSATAIVDQLHTLGYSSIKSSDLSAPLIRLTQQQFLSRQRDDKSNWLYSVGPNQVAED